MSQFCSEMDTRLAMETGTCLMLIRHLLVTKVLSCDMSEPIDDTMSISRLGFTGMSVGRASA